MKTKLIEELVREPVRRETGRVYAPNPVVIQEEYSEIAEEHGQEQERYTFELKLGARFVNFPGNTHELSRHYQHKILIRTITEHVYHDIRHKLREMFPIVCDCADYDAREKLIPAIDELLAMTVPDD